MPIGRETRCAARRVARQWRRRRHRRYSACLQVRDTHARDDVAERPRDITYVSHVTAPDTTVQSPDAVVRS